jgi:GNAT superfamily N-acetyltransferase
MTEPELEISTDRGRLDVALVHDFLSTSSYWAQGRPRAVIERSIANSLCFGAYHAGAQVGFCRVVTDYAVFGYLADMFVVPAWRGRGVAARLLRAVIEHPEVVGLHGLQLRSRDARGLYARFGFQPIPRPEEVMVRYASEPPPGPALPPAVTQT